MVHLGKSGTEALGEGSVKRMCVCSPDGVAKLKGGHVVAWWGVLNCIWDEALLLKRAIQQECFKITSCLFFLAGAHLHVLDFFKLPFRF